MKDLFINPKVGDEFYKIRNGDSIGYYKCKIVEIKEDWCKYPNVTTKPNYITYYIKGKGKNSKDIKCFKYFKNVDIMVNKCTYFQNKIDMMLYANRFSNIYLLSKQLQLELKLTKEKYPQHFI